MLRGVQDNSFSNYYSGQIAKQNRPQQCTENGKIEAIHNQHEQQQALYLLAI